MWLLLIGFLITLWAIALMISLMWRWIPPGDGVYRPPQGPVNKA
jgi:steroid 5-alpha reductase family enzyme